MPDFAPALIVLGSFYIVAFFFFGIGIRQSKTAGRSILADREAVAQLIRDVTGESPDSPSVSSPPQYTLFKQFAYVVLLCILFTLIYAVLYFSVSMGVRLIWPNLATTESQFADIAASLLIPLILGWVVLPLVERWLILSPSQHTFTDREKSLFAVMDYAKGVAINGASIGILVVVEIAYGWLPAFVVVVVYYFVFVVLWRLFSKSALYFPRYWVQSALANAKYEEALRRNQQLESKFSENVISLYNRGTILLFVGKFTEGEQLLRQCLQQAQQNSRCLPEALTNLGYALFRQGRYEEATRALQGAIKINPSAGHAYSGLAEIYLYQAIEPQHALDLLVRFLKSTPRRQVKDKSIWGSVLGDEAWALALVGRHAAARQALREAMELTDKSFKPGLASLHFREGKVYQIQGDRPRAVQSFQRAIQLDPSGAYGQLSQQAMEELTGEDN